MNSSEKQLLNGWRACEKVVLLCESYPTPISRTESTLLTASRQRIYFDGFLPPAKLKTRLKRLEAQTRQSIDYYDAHPIPCRAPSKNFETTSYSIFEGQAPAPRPSLTSLPPPPFLVPAILEALKLSKDYSDMTEVVPGEADLYCARYTKRHGGVVFTGDSDLLVQDLGFNGAVSFFNDIECSSDGPGALHTQMYQSTDIAARLGLPKSHGLLSLAFEMFMDNHGTFSKLLSQAVILKAIKTWAKEYEEFRKEYIPLNAEVESSIPALGIFQSLDPRISEIILQFSALAKLAGQDPAARNPKRDLPHMFFPFLLDCPVRTSAWEMSTSVRQLACGLINLIVPEDQQYFTVIEHRRQQKNSIGREWQLPSLSEIPDACMALLNLLKELEEKLPKASEGDLWLAVAICQEMEWSTSLDKTPLCRTVTNQLFNLQEKYHKNCTWDMIHFLAQIQGSYYSFRILKQVIGVLMSHNDAPLLPNAVRQLNSRLECLPGFCDVMDLNHMAWLYQKIETNGLLKVAREVLGIEEPTSVESNESFPKPSRRKRKRKGVADVSGPSTRKSMSRNPFELLEQE
jgi:hypothetical protein